MYDEAERNFYDEEWHDSYVLDVVLKRHKQKFPNSPIKKKVQWTPHKG